MAAAMHGRSIAWVRDRCRLEGAYRPLLYAIATHAGKHYADCTASAATLARSSGLSHRHVQRLLPELVGMGTLDQLDPGAGRRPACYRINPTLWATSGDTTSPQDLSTGPPSYDTMTQQRSLADALGLSSYDMTNPVATTLEIRSYDTPPPLSSANGRQEKYLEEKREEKNVRSNPSSSLPKSKLDPYDPYPEVDEKHKQYLRERYGPKNKSGQEQEQPTAAGTGTAP